MARTVEEMHQLEIDKRRASGEFPMRPADAVMRASIDPDGFIDTHTVAGGGFRAIVMTMLRGDLIVSSWAIHREDLEELTAAFGPEEDDNPPAPKTFRELYNIPIVSNFKYGEPTMREDDGWHQRVHITSLSGELWCKAGAEFDLPDLSEFPGMGMAEAAELTESKVCAECLREAQQNEQDQA